MKTLKLTFSILFIISPLLLFCQLKHDVKIEGFGAFLNNNFIPSYELILKKRIGVEIEIGLDFGDRVLRDPTFTTNGTRFKQKRFNPGLSGKYYFLFTKYGNGLFIGPYVRLDYLTFLEDGFYKKWEEVNSRPTPYWAEKGLRNINYGFNGGFKLLIKSHFIVEGSLLWTIQDEQRPESVPDVSKNIEGFIFLRLGYRF